LKADSRGSLEAFVCDKYNKRIIVEKLKRNKQTESEQNHRIKELEDLVRKQEEYIEHLRYQPDGVEFLKIEKNFYGLADQKTLKFS